MDRNKEKCKRKMKRAYYSRVLYYFFFFAFASILFLILFFILHFVSHIFVVVFLLFFIFLFLLTRNYTIYTTFFLCAIEYYIYVGVVHQKLNAFVVVMEMLYFLRFFSRLHLLFFSSASSLSLYSRLKNRQKDRRVQKLQK